MTIVMWIRVHPYKATHYENRKSILHFIAFMVLHTDSHRPKDCIRIPINEKNVNFIFVKLMITYLFELHDDYFSTALN